MEIWTQQPVGIQTPNLAEARPVVTNYWQRFVFHPIVEPQYPIFTFFSGGRWVHFYSLSFHVEMPPLRILVLWSRGKGSKEEIHKALGKSSITLHPCIPATWCFQFWISVHSSLLNNLHLFFSDFLEMLLLNLCCI